LGRQGQPSLRFDTLFLNSLNQCPATENTSNAAAQANSNDKKALSSSAHLDGLSHANV